MQKSDDYSCSNETASQSSIHYNIELVRIEQISFDATSTVISVLSGRPV